MGDLRFKLLGAVLVCACSAQSTQVVAPDGYNGYFIECGETINCLTEAQDLCPRGYVVFDSTQFTNAVLVRGDRVPVQRREMLIRCRRRDERAQRMRERESAP
jgi:hypothetical protein